MKLTDWIVNTIGTDKILHFLVFAWIMSIVSPLNIWWSIAVFVLMTVLSVVKEIIFDKTFDKKDIFAGVLGGLISFIIGIIIKSI